MRPGPSQERIDSDALAERMLARDEHAFREFAEIFGPRLRRLFLAAGVPNYEAEDLAVSCITDIALNVPSYQPGNGGFAKWVWTIAKHKLADYLSNARRSPPLAEGTASDDNKDSRDMPDEAATAAVRKALDQLAQPDQEIVMLRGSDWATFEEIEKILALSPGAARVRYQRALRRLKAILETGSSADLRTKG